MAQNRVTYMEVQQDLEAMIEAKCRELADEYGLSVDMVYNLIFEYHKWIYQVWEIPMPISVN